MPLAAPWLGWAALVLFVTACNRITPPPPAATPTAALPTATARPTATPQAPEAEQSLLEQAMLALIEAGGFQSETVVTYFTDPPQAFPLRVDTSYQIADSEQVHHIAHWPEGLREETICTGSKRWEQCWTRVGTHPWTRAITLEFDPTMLEQRRSLEARAVITATTPLTLTGEILVEWRVPLDETEFIGQSWLKADSLLPVREVSEVREPDGSTRFRDETRFKRYDAAIGVATPVVATVTPAPTIAPTEGTEFKTRVEEAPLPGTLVVPEGEGPFPAAVVLHGSEGGVRYSKPLARRLGQAGYVALALCYFECAGAPERLENVDVEVVMEAVDLLKERADVQPNAIAVAGLSRGAELALITGALDPDVHAVVSIMGTYQVHGALQPDGVAWLYQGKPLPFEWIPVEQIKGPVLLLHGEQDARWPVGHSYLVADRLAAHGRPYEIIVYPGPAHNLGSEDTFFGPSLTFCLARCWARAAR